MKDRILGLTERTCKICGKKFEAAPEYVYKRKQGQGREIYFCSYTCMRTYDKRTVSRKYSKSGSSPDAVNLI